MRLELLLFSFSSKKPKVSLTSKGKIYTGQLVRWMTKARNMTPKEKRKVEISNNSLRLILNCNFKSVVEVLTLFR